jgi:hypothetical protein
MSNVEGSVFELYQGTRWRRSSVSVLTWPCNAYQIIKMLWQNSPKGTVRSTAFRTRLRACPTPRMFLTSKNVTSIDQRAA